MIGGYAQQSYGFNYYGTVGSNRDEFVIVRKMAKVDWLEGPLADSRSPGGRSMKIRAQIGMVLNLDKCIGCHTCSVTCKNVWTSREGVEYAWFNNVETKPGIGYPKDWENQKRWNGGWVRKPTARSSRAWAPSGGCWRRSSPTPTCRDRRLLRAVHLRLRPSAEGAGEQGVPDRAPALADHRRADGEDRMGPELGGNPRRRIRQALAGLQLRRREKEIYGQFENTFMMYLPRLCEHCLNPACVAACPSGAIYKREEDGIVLIDQDKCRGWRMCVSGCPYKKIYYNWSSGKSEKCIFCYPAHRGGQPTVCSETCVGRIRYLGVMLYDADRIEEAASVPDESRSLSGAARHLPRSQRSGVIAQARKPTACRSLARRRAPLAGLEDGDGMEGRLPAAPRIPHAADGLVRAAAVADPVALPRGQDRRTTEMPDVRSCAFRCATSPTC
jgi:nitrate reductase beta subunit